VAAFSLVRSRARGLTSTAYTCAFGALVASTAVTGPYPQPMSSRAPVVDASGSGAFRSRTAVPRSRRSAENTPVADASRYVRPAIGNSTHRRCSATAGSVLK
jgi:hypothetical protein